MYHTQSNAARFIYTLNDFNEITPQSISIVSAKSNQRPPISLTDVNLNTAKQLSTETTTQHRQFGCILDSNRFWFSKEARSDEKVRFTESDMYDIIRTVLFLYVFDTQPDQTMVEIVNIGEVSFPNCHIDNMRELTISIAADLLDTLFGRNFATITSRALVKCYTEYEMTWRYATFSRQSQILAPSALDLRKLCMFVNVTSPVYSRPTQFINNNTMDNKIPLQTNYKYLP